MSKDNILTKALSMGKPLYEEVTSEDVVKNIIKFLDTFNQKKIQEFLDNCTDVQSYIPLMDFNDKENKKILDELNTQFNKTIAFSESFINSIDDFNKTTVKLSKLIQKTK